MNSELMIDYFDKKGWNINLDRDALKESLRIASEIFI